MSIKLEIKRAALLATLSVTGMSACIASIPTLQSIPAAVQSGGNGTQCPGSFIAYSTMTNSSGSIWMTVPAGETNAILSEMSTDTNYACVVSAMYRNSGSTWCAADSVSFPVVAGGMFQYKLYVVSGSVTNGQPLPMMITYQP